MGSCLSSDSRSPLATTPMSPLGIRRKKSSKKRLGLGSRNSSLDYGREEQLHRIQGRMFVNGSSEVASLFTRQGKKGTNQDAMIVWENFGSRSDTIFCGVFDGHGPYGHLVAKRVRDSLPLRLSEHWEVNIKSNDVLRENNLNPMGSISSGNASFLPADEESKMSIDVEVTEKQPEFFQTLKESFFEAFKVMDRELKLYANIDCFCSGTTAVTLVKQGQDLVIGNVGDSRAVLGTRDAEGSLTAVQLTVDLKPNLPAEAERIRKYKGRVFALKEEPEVARVWLPDYNSPGLAMARAFGDFCLKQFGLISVPDISYRHLTDKDEFVVLATDGIWDVLSNKEVVDIVASAQSRSSAAREIVQSAVRGWRSKYPTSKVDDCAVVCLFLDSSSDNLSSASTADKEKTLSMKKEVHGEGVPQSSPTQLNCSGKVTEVGLKAADVAESKEEASKHEELNIEMGEEWSALEGVARVDTLLNFPRFEPGSEKIGASETKKHK